MDLLSTYCEKTQNSILEAFFLESNIYISIIGDLMRTQIIYWDGSKRSYFNIFEASMASHTFSLLLMS